MSQCVDLCLHGLVRFADRPGYAAVADFGPVAVRRDRSDLGRPGDDFHFHGPQVQLAARLLYRGPALQDHGPVGFVLADAAGAALLISHGGVDPALPVLPGPRTESWIGFPAGTRIGDGATQVELLRPGDTLPGVDGGPRTILRADRHFASALVHEPAHAAPIRIAAEALGAGLPACDLVLAPSQPFRLGDRLVHPAALLGLPGVSALALDDPPIAYHTVQLDQDACVMVAGLAAEFGRAPAAADPPPEPRPGWQDLPRLYSVRQRPPALWRSLGGS